jgi:hypothetical protein
MNLTYWWDFPAFDCYPDKDGYVDLVFTVHWRYNAKDEDGHSAVVYSTQAVSYKEGDPFVAFADLTPELVTEWVTDAMGEERVAALTANLAAQIEQQIHPSQVTLPPPWQTPPMPPDPKPEPEPEPTPEPEPEA